MGLKLVNWHKEFICNVPMFGHRWSDLGRKGKSCQTDSETLILLTNLSMKQNCVYMLWILNIFYRYLTNMTLRLKDISTSSYRNSNKLWTTVNLNTTPHRPKLYLSFCLYFDYNCWFLYLDYHCYAVIWQLVGHASRSVNTNLVVPQVCIFEPTLFLMFINDLPYVTISKLGIFADGTTNYYCFSSKW